MRPRRVLVRSLQRKQPNVHYGGALRMKRLLTRQFCILFSAFALHTSATFAHHSFAMFDTQKTIAITGKVRELVWANPHAWLYVNAQKPDGTFEEWALECSSPNMMIRWGWNANDINAGDTITVDIHPNRDGRHQGSVYAVFLADGRVFADPIGRFGVSGDDLAKGPPSLPKKPTGVPLK